MTNAVEEAAQIGLKKLEETMILTEREAVVYQHGFADGVAHGLQSALQAARTVFKTAGEQ